jgi:GNAT superfamily N-acetyltransferase
MITELYNLSTFLNYLYRDEIRHVEEISMIEQMYLNPDIRVFVDDIKDISKFLLIRENRLCDHSAFLEAGNDDSFLLQAADLLKPCEKLHLQTGEWEKSRLENQLSVIHSYGYVIMEFRPENFNPVFKPVPVKLTADSDAADLREISCGDTDRFREEIRHGTLFGFKIDNKWVSTAGSLIRSRNCNYIFVDTDAEHRGKGFAGSVLSHAIRDVIDRGKKPVYALDSENKPSMKLAKKMGFVPYTTLECMFTGPRWTLVRETEDSVNIPDSSFYL